MSRAAPPRPAAARPSASNLGAHRPQISHPVTAARPSFSPGQFGGGEPAGSRFGGPHFLALDGKGRLYTTEGTPGRVQQFSADGKPLLSWGDHGDGPGGFGALKTGYSKSTFGPVAITVDARDRVWVSSLNDRVQAFTPEGKFLFGIGGTGQAPGQFSRPHGMAFDRKGHLYVADASNQRIQKFEVPDL